MRISTDSHAFTLLICVLAALPSFGIDVSLPALGAIGSSLGVDADTAGLTISLFMVGYAIAPPICGPISDRIGRKPIVLGALALFAFASIGCALADTLPQLLFWRVLQGMGAGIGTTITFAIIEDLFGGAAGRTKFSDLAMLIVLVPTLAPAAGTAVLAIGSWRTLYALLAIVGLVLFGAIGLLFEESARPDPAGKLEPAAILRSYGMVLGDPVCLGYILVNAMGFGALFAYVSGSSLLFIDGLGVSPGGYSIVYAASFAGLIASLFVNGQLSRRGVASVYPLVFGIALGITSATAFLIAILVGWRWVPGLSALLALGTMAFGFIAPNAIHAIMQPLPGQAGAVSATAGLIQVIVQSATSAAVVMFNASYPGLSMAVVLVVCWIGAIVAYTRVARPAEMRTTSHTPTFLEIEKCPSIPN